MLRTVGSTLEQRFNCAGLTHPRTLAGDFETLVQDLQSAFDKTFDLPMKIIRPRVLVHVVPPQEGGVTPIELRAFQEAAIAAAKSGAVLVAAEPNRPLSDTELQGVFDAL
ncbi:MAG: hypothetical protein AAF529_13745 [Pseudomonadota bacterium]